LRIASTGPRSSSGTASTNADFTVLLNTTPLRDIDDDDEDDEEEAEVDIESQRKKVTVE
jgi:hypothetical protein